MLLTIPVFCFLKMGSIGMRRGGDHTLIVLSYKHVR